MVTTLRWWLFKRLSDLGWYICPEPNKSRLQQALPTWDHLKEAIEVIQERKNQ